MDVITFTAHLWLWRSGKGSWHFITVPEEQSLEIRAESFATRGGSGSVKVEACISDVTWRTSVFPQKDGGFILPVKADVRKRVAICAEDIVEVTLRVL